MGYVGNTLGGLAGIISCIWCILFALAVGARAGPFAWNPLTPCMASCLYSCCGPALAKFIPF